MQVITLQYPLTDPALGEIRTVHLRRAKVRDLVMAQEPGGSSARQEVRLFSILTGLPMDVIDEMDEVDYADLQRTYSGFRKPPSPPLTSPAPSSASVG